MQTANILLSLGGDGGNTVPKFGVTAAEVAVLRAIHGESAVQEIEPAGDIERSNKEELQRLTFTYGRAKTDTPEGQRAIVTQLFPGAAARVFTSFDELDIPDEFYKAGSRMKPEAEAAPKKARRKKQDEAAEPIDPME